MDTVVGKELIYAVRNPNKVFFAKLCFYLFWSIQMVSKGLAFEDADRIYKILSLVSLGFLALKFLLTDWEFQELVIACALVFCGFMCYLMTGMLPLTILALALVGMKDVPVRPLLIYTFYLRAAIYLYMVSGAILGFIPEILFGKREIFDIVAYFFTGDFHVVTVRRSIGYSNPNVAHISFLVIALLYLYVRKNKLYVLEYLGIVFSNYILYRWTGSRTSMLVVFFALLLSILIRIRFFKKPLYIIGACSFFALLAFSVIMGHTFEELSDDPTLWQRICAKLDSLFSTRLGLNHYAVSTFSVWTPFGQKFQNDWSMLDNAYLNFWLRFGLINCALFLWANTGYLLRCKRLDREEAFVAIVSMAVLGMMEMSLYSVTMNVFLLLLSVYLYPSKRIVFPAENPIVRMLQ
ncbi:MAG: hypothetical protein J6D37_06085 [Clostridia bacterium]|nr:hypothetical protein [Clostridia bacterium]